MMDIHAKDPEILNDPISGVARAALSHLRIHGKRFTLGQTGQK